MSRLIPFQGSLQFFWLKKGWESVKADTFSRFVAIFLVKKRWESVKIKACIVDLRVGCTNPL